MLLIVSALLLMITNTVTYVQLLAKNENLKSILAEKKKCGGFAKEVVEELAGHVYYDGDSIRSGLKASHYNRFGKKLGDVGLDEILRGDKVLLLLSSKCSVSCATNEIKKLLNLTKIIGREHIVIVADYAIHYQPSWIMCLDREGFYETETKHLGLRGSHTWETPVVMLTQNGRIKTSFLIGQHTQGFADGFHDYLVEFFNEGKKK